MALLFPDSSRRRRRRLLLLSFAGGGVPSEWPDVTNTGAINPGTRIAVPSEETSGVGWTWNAGTEMIDVGGSAGTIENLDVAGGLNLTGDTNTITNCTFTMQAGNTAGIYVGGPVNYIEYCTVIGADVAGSRGVFIDTVSGAQLVALNIGMVEVGIYTTGASGSFDSNWIHDPAADGTGIEIATGGGAVIGGNNVEMAVDESVAALNMSAECTNCTVSGNRLMNAYETVKFWFDTSNIFTLNTLGGESTLGGATLFTASGGLGSPSISGNVNEDEADDPYLIQDFGKTDDTFVVGPTDPLSTVGQAEFQGLSIGQAHDDRVVHFFVTYMGATVLPALTVAEFSGATITIDIGVTNGLGGSFFGHVATASFSTGDLELTFDQDLQHIAATVYRSTQYDSLTPVFTGTDARATAGAMSADSVSAEPTGYRIGGAYNSGGVLRQHTSAFARSADGLFEPSVDCQAGASTWTGGLTEDTDVSVEGGGEGEMTACFVAFQATVNDVPPPAYETWTGPGWFDASDVSTVTKDGSSPPNVTALANKRSGGGDLTYAGTAGNCDWITGGAPSGLDCLRVTRNTSAVPRLVASNADPVSTMFQGDDKPYTVFYVYKPTDNNSGNLWSASDTVDAVDSQWAPVMVRNTTASASMRKRLTTAAPTTQNFGAQANGTARIVVARSNGTLLSVWDNSLTKSLDEVAQNIGATNAELAFQLWSSENEGASDPTIHAISCAQDWYEVIVEDSVRTVAEIEEAITDLAIKWGITLS